MNKADLPCRYGLNCRRSHCQYNHEIPQNYPETNPNDPNNGQSNYSQMKNQRISRSKYFQNKQYQRQSRYYDHPSQDGSSSHMKSLRDNSKGQEQDYEPHQRRHRDQYRSRNHNNRSYSKNRQQNHENCRPQRFENNFCRHFHLTNECKYMPNCNRSHEFTFNDPLTIKRLVFTTNIPLIPKSKLVAQVHQDKLVYTIRGKDSIFLFKFAPDVNKLELEHEFPVSRNNDNFFDNKGSIFLCSFANELTTFEDFYVYDMHNNKTSFIQNTHESKITGIVHLDKSLILTSSLDGQLKAWNLTEEEIKNDLKTSNTLNQCFNPRKIKISLLFLMKTEIGVFNMVLVGTNDSRLLIWTSKEDTAFTQVTLKAPEYNNQEIHLQVYKAKPIVKEVLLQSIYVIAKDRESHYIFRGSFEEPEYQLIYAHRNSFPEALHTFDIYEDLLFVSEKPGIMIYRLSDTRTKIGCILQNFLSNDIIVEQTMLKITAVKFPVLAVLEPAGQENDEKGHFSIYLIK